MEILYWLEKIRTPALDAAMSLLTELGGETVFLLLTIVVYWCVDKQKGYFMLVVGFAGLLINQFLKLAIRIPRPWVRDPSFSIVESARADAGGYSFPSGHTQNATSSFGCIARSTTKRWVRIFSISAVLITGFSRMYLGVHTLADVVVSLLIGALLVWAIYPIMERSRKKPAILLAFMGALSAAAVAFLLYVRFWRFPADIDMENLTSGTKNAYVMLGAMLGGVCAFALDARYVHFDTNAVWWAQALKLAIGLSVTLLLKEMLKAPLSALFGGHALAHTVRYFLLVFFAAGVWPSTFRYFSALGKRKEVQP